MFKFNFTEPENSVDHVIKSEIAESHPPLQIHKLKNDQYENNGTGSYEVLNYSFGKMFYLLNSTDTCDLQDGHYEGGNVVWECTIDLLKYFEKNDISFENKSGTRS